MCVQTVSSTMQKVQAPFPWECERQGQSEQLHPAARCHEPALQLLQARCRRQPCRMSENAGLWTHPPTSVNLPQAPLATSSSWGPPPAS